MKGLDSVVRQIAQSKARWFDRYIELHQSMWLLDLSISEIVVPEDDWRKGHFSAPVRWSVASEKGFFFATVQLDLTKSNPNVEVTTMARDPSGVYESLDLQRYIDTPATWENAVIEARWSVQFAAEEAVRRNGLTVAERMAREASEREEAWRQAPLFPGIVAAWRRLAG